MKNLSSCVVLGGGAHARIVIDCLRESGAADPVAILDAGLAGGAVDGVPVRGGDELLPSLREQGILGFIVGVGGTGDNNPRRAAFDRACAAGLDPVSAVHPRAIIASDVVIGRGCLVSAGAIVGRGVILGDNVIVNTGSVIDHDCVLADHVHVSPGATLCGGVRVDTGAHIGAGAVVRQALTIGEAAVVGLGAAVVRDVPASETVVGNPATARR